MSFKITAFFVIVFFCCFYSLPTLGSDPDPVQDFCIPTDISNSSIPFPCKDPSMVTVEDFIFSGIQSPGKMNSETGFSSLPVNANTFPGLNTLGMSLVRADFDIGGVNVPHLHPRATEMALVLEGKIYSGFVDSENRVFARVLEKGEVMVYPRGLVHFQMNVGDKRAMILGSFDSQNPGLVKLPSALFGSEIKGEVLEKAFGLSGMEISKLRKRFIKH